MLGLTRRMKDAAGRYREYRRIVSEIESLSPREANDLGISTADARRIAQQSVYGG